MPASAAIPDPTLYDFASLYQLGEAAAASSGREKPTLNLRPLRKAADQAREALGMRPATTHLAVIAADTAPESPAARFVGAVRAAGFDTVVTDFRNAFPSLAPGQSMSEATGRNTTSLVPQISYILGTLSSHCRPEAQPHILVISHAFELLGPLADLADRGAKVGLAFVRSGLDPRWERLRQGDRFKGSEIRFFDLDEFAEELVGNGLPGSASPVAQAARLSQF